MPNCFQLTRKSKPDEGPVSLSVIDEEICKLMGQPVHPTQYHLGWFDYIGFGLAVGKSFADIRAMILAENNTDTFRDKYLAIVDFLDTNFVSNAWYQRGR